MTNQKFLSFSTKIRKRWKILIMALICTALIISVYAMQVIWSNKVVLKFETPVYNLTLSVHNSTIPTFNGRLTDGNENGVPNALISLYRNGTFTGTTTTTNSTGFYAITWLSNDTGTFEFQTKAEVGSASLFEYNYGDASGASYVYGDLWWAQTFTPSAEHKIRSVRFFVSRKGYPGIVTISISAVNDTTPVGDLIVTTINGNSLLSDAKSWEEVVFENELSLEANTMYAIVVRCLSGDSENYLVWWEGDVYSGGTLCEGNVWGGVVHWQSRGGMDFMFEEWGY